MCPLIFGFWVAQFKHELKLPELVQSFDLSLIQEKAPISQSMRLPNLRGVNKDVFIEWLIGNKVLVHYMLKKLTKKLIEMSERNFREKDKTLEW